MGFYKSCWGLCSLRQTIFFFHFYTASSNHCIWNICFLFQYSTDWFHQLQMQFSEFMWSPSLALSVLWFQACTEVNLCYESNNVTDMFPPMPFTEKDRMQYCLKRWAVIPNPKWFKVQFWGDGKWFYLSFYSFALCEITKTEIKCVHSLASPHIHQTQRLKLHYIINYTRNTKQVAEVHANFWLTVADSNIRGKRTMATLCALIIHRNPHTRSMCHLNATDMGNVTPKP